MDTMEAKLKELGFTLPEAPKPQANYLMAKRVGELLFVSGQLPIIAGQLIYQGKVGAERTLQEGQEAARLCALNALAVIKALVGSLEKIEEIVQLRGFVNCTPQFTQQPEVLNGASELLAKLFGERGRHARAAIGASSLPRNATVELEMIVQFRA